MPIISACCRRLPSVCRAEMARDIPARQTAAFGGSAQPWRQTAAQQTAAQAEMIGNQRMLAETGSIQRQSTEIDGTPLQSARHRLWLTQPYKPRLLILRSLTPQYACANKVGQCMCWLAKQFRCVNHFASISVSKQLSILHTHAWHTYSFQLLVCLHQYLYSD